jgi:hypothetical protein
VTYFALCYGRWKDVRELRYKSEVTWACFAIKRTGWVQLDVGFVGIEG